MSDTPQQDDPPEGGGDTGPDIRNWVPSPEQPVPPTTTEFNALVDSGAAVPAEDPVEEQPVAVGEPETVVRPGAEAPTGSAPQATAAEPPAAPVGDDATTGSAPQAAAEPSPSGGPSFAPAADPAPPREPGPYADPEPDGSGGPAPSTSTDKLAGLIPEDRPELLLAAAFGGGVLVAIALRILVRR